MTFHIARMILQDIGLDYAAVMVMEQNQAANKTVISQDLARNSIIPQRTQIVLTVSQGP